MAKRDLDCLILAGSEGYSNGFGVNYVSNYPRTGYVVFPLEGDPTLAVPINISCHLPNVRAVSVIKDIRSTIAGAGPVVVERIRELGLEKKGIGITVSELFGPGHTIPLGFYNYLRENLPEARLELLNVDFLINIWLIKSSEEIRFFEKAAEICDLAVERAVKTVKPGVKEYEVAAAMKHEILRKQGEVAFVMVGGTSMADPALSFPNWIPPARRFQKGDILINEVGARYGGLEAQNGKPMTLGEPTNRYKDFYENIVLKTFEQIVEALKPGNTLKEIQKTGSTMAKAGYQAAAPLVHGVGITQDIPFVFPGFAIPTDDFKLQPNMMLVPEVNPQTPDGRFGVFLGDTYVITQDGARRLNKYPLELTII
jgi:Xaa-Pro aminopeptidase